MQGGRAGRPINSRLSPELNLVLVVLVAERGLLGPGDAAVARSSRNHVINCLLYVTWAVA